MLLYILLDLASISRGLTSINELILLLISSKASSKRGFNLLLVQKTDFKTKTQAKRIWLDSKKLPTSNTLSQHYMIIEAKKNN